MTYPRGRPFGATIAAAVPRPSQRHPPAAVRTGRLSPQRQASAPPPLPTAGPRRHTRVAVCAGRLSLISLAVSGRVHSPSPPLVRGSIPARPSVRGDNHCGRSAASTAISLRGRSRGALISAATGLRSPSPRRCSSAATHLRGRPRGATFAPAVLRRCGRQRVALFPPHRLSAVMFPRSYLRGALTSASAAGLRSFFPTLARGDTSRTAVRVGHWAPITAPVPRRRPWRRATLIPPIAVMSPPGRPCGVLISVAIPWLRLRQRASAPLPRHTSTATCPTQSSARGADLRGRGRGGGPPLPLPADCPWGMSVIVWLCL